MGFSKPDSFERLDSVKGRAISSAGVSRSARGERTDAHKVKGLSHHGQPQATILTKYCQHHFLLLYTNCLGSKDRSFSEVIITSLRPAFLIMAGVAFVQPRDLLLGQSTFRMPPLINRRRAGIIIIALFIGLAVAWIYWNRPQKTDMSQFAPVGRSGIRRSQRFKRDYSMALNRPVRGRRWRPPLVRLQGSRLIVGGLRWLDGQASGRLTPFFSRAPRSPWFSQGLKEIRPGNTLTIKPLTTFIIETHTSQRRMRAAVERHLEDFARRIYKDPIFVRKDN
jgi:hypothetical protein